MARRHASGEPERPTPFASLSIPEPDGGAARRRQSRSGVRLRHCPAAATSAPPHGRPDLSPMCSPLQHLGPSLCLGTTAVAEGGHATNPLQLMTSCARMASGGKLTTAAQRHQHNPSPRDGNAAARMSEASKKGDEHRGHVMQNSGLLFVQGITMQQHQLLPLVLLNSQVFWEQKITMQAVARPFLEKMTKTSFPKFVIIDWNANFLGYFCIIEGIWISVTLLHVEGNAAQLVQPNKRHDWTQFMEVVKAEFVVDDYRKSMIEFVELKQTNSVEEYAEVFEEARSQVSVHNSGLDETFFVAHFVRGLKEEIKSAVKYEVPISVDRAILLAKTQQEILDKSNFHSSKDSMPARSASLTYWDKFEPGHLEKCKKRPRQELIQKGLDWLNKEDALPNELCHVSLNAISGTEGDDNIRLRALVKNQMMLALVDSGSSNNFVNACFLAKVGIKPVPTVPMSVKVANGQVVISKYYVPQMEWCIQGYNFRADMRVIELGVYDAILGYEWLKPRSPMNCHWAEKTIQFESDGKQVKLQGVIENQRPPLKRVQGNEMRAFAVEQYEPQAAVNAPSTELLDSASTNTDANHPMEGLIHQDDGAYTCLDGAVLRARNTVSGLDGCPENWESVHCAGNDDDYDDLLSAINNVTKSDMVAVRKVYDAFLLRFPLCHEMWNKYASLEACAGTNKQQEVYGRAVASAPYSVDIWVSYCQYLISSCGNPVLIRREIEKGLDYIGTNYNSNILWDELINFEKSREEWSRVASIYARMLQQPIHQLLFYRECLQDCIEMHHSDIPNYSNFLALDSKVSIAFKNAAKLDQKIKCFEQAMTTKCFSFKPLSETEIKNWHNYLDFMQNQGDTHQVYKLYERCLIVCANYSEFWMRYVIYLRLQGKIELANGALSRATDVFVKKDRSIHLFSAWFKEFNGDVGGARQAYHYVYSKLCPGMVHAIVKLANLERRQRGKEHGCSIYENTISEEKKTKESKILPSLMVEYIKYIFLVCCDGIKAKEMLRVLLLECECITKQNLEDIIDLETKIPGTKRIELIAGAVQKFLETEYTQQASEMCDKEHISSILIKFLERFGSLQLQLLKKAESRHRRMFSCKSKISYPSLKRKAVDLGDKPSKVRRTNEQELLPPVAKDHHSKPQVVPLLTTYDSSKVRSTNEQAPPPPWQRMNNLNLRC